MRSVSVGRRPAITSSSSSSFGSVASARATSSRLRSGSVSAEARWCALVVEVEPAQHLAARARARRATSAAVQQRADDDVVLDRQRRERPHDLEGAADAAPADLVGRQAVDALAGEGDRAAVGRDSTPAIMLNSVVLPAPFGPITAKIAPCGTSKLTLSTASRPRKRLLTPSTDKQRAHVLRSVEAEPAREPRPDAVRQRHDHQQQADAVEHLLDAGHVDAERAQRSSVSASARPVSTKAPRIGPNSVPMPPMIGPRMISIEREMWKTCSGNRLL